MPPFGVLSRAIPSGALKEWDMRNAILMAAAFVAAAPAGAKPKEPRSVDLSARPVEDLAGCVALRLAEASGYEIRKSQTASATELQMKYRVAGVAATAASFVIEDLGDKRRLTIFATGKSNGAPRTIAARTRQCVNA
jgi:hypothetical protein